MNKKLQLTLLSILLSNFMLQAQSVSTDSLTIATDSVVDVKQKKGLINKIIKYFEESNVPKEDKALDISFIGGPHYSSDTKLGIGLIASGLFRIDRSDKSISPSNVSVYSDFTTTGSYVFGLSGNILFPREDYRIDLVTYFSSTPSRYWGIGYEAGREDHYTKYTDNEVQVKVNLLKKIFSNSFLGFVVDYNNVRGIKMKDVSFLNGEPLKSSYGGFGFNYSYDTRDFIPNPYKGIYIKLEYLLYPKMIGNRNTISKTEILFRTYQEVWKDGVLALDVFGSFQGGSVPWNMLITTGNSKRMRGYYEGRYRDKMFAQTQLELRQRVWRRNGIAVWAGAGNIFDNFNDFSFSKMLPTFGVGYRWEFKKRVNVRLDYGIGKGSSAFYVNINEAF